MEIILICNRWQIRVAGCGVVILLDWIAKRAVYIHLSSLIPATSFIASELWVFFLIVCFQYRLTNNALQHQITLRVCGITVIIIFREPAPMAGTHPVPDLITNPALLRSRACGVMHAANPVRNQHSLVFFKMVCMILMFIL